MSDFPQLTLTFPPAPAGFRAADLLPNAAQDEARTWLARTPDWPLRRLVLWGGPGCGKSHLLHAWAEAVGGAVLAGVPPVDFPNRPVALDQLDAVRDEIGLLHLLNAAQEARQPLLLACSVPPGRLPVRLPDLASRLRATTAVRIGPAPDDFLAMLLARLLAERQLRLPPALQSWLLTRLPRTPEALRDAVRRLDAAGLETGRSITRPLAAEVLSLHDNSMARPGDPSPEEAGPG
ncbi:MAG: HdaA/DnaA family protein [Janthinobacterium lividum]